jgi:competence protein ComEA
VASPPPADALAVAGGPSAGPAPRPGGDPGAPPAAVPPVDLNRAGAAELDALPGIGPVLAGRILRHREAHGAFRAVDDLLAVPGIGPRLLERLRPRVRAGPAPDSVAAGVAIGKPAPGQRLQIPVQPRPGGGR